MKILMRTPLSHAKLDGAKCAHISRLNRMLFSVFIILSLSLTFGCRKKTIPMDKMPESRIIFGNGGGFTGEVKEYHLLNDGRIVNKGLKDTIYNVLSRIGKSNAATCFEDCKKMKLDSMKFSEPGNRYYFIAVKEAGKPENRIVWGDNDLPVLESVKTFYKTLMSHLPKDKIEDK